MTIVGARTSSELDRAVDRYDEALSAIEEATSKPSKQQVLKALLARDAVEQAISAKTKASEETISTLIELDSRLKKQAHAIASDDKLINCRQSLNPPESAWWWFLESPTQMRQKGDRFDWVWNGLTVACLVCAGTFASHTIKAFSANGSMDLLQIFGTLSQGAGLALVTGGALTDKGQKTVGNILSSLKIPSHLHAEATFGASALLLLATYGLNKSLPELGEFYYKQGQKNYENGQLSKALENYEEANTLAPDTPKIQVAAGKIHESLGQFDEAKSQYQKGLIQGEPSSFNALGRTILQTATKPEDPLAAEAYFRIALKEDRIDDPLKAELYTNLGLAQMKRASVENLPKNQVDALRQDAKKNLEVAIALDKKIPPKTPGWGMASCYLATLLEENGSLKDAAIQRQSCEKAKPETIAQYETMMGIGGEKIAANVETKNIVDRDPRLAANVQPSPLANEAQTSPVAADGNQPVTATAQLPPPPPQAELISPEQLEELKQSLYNKIDQSWSTAPTFEQNLVYRVGVTKNGAIAAYQPTDQIAADFLQETPLPKLLNSAANTEPLIGFTVVFTPLGKLEINPQVTTNQPQ